MKYTKESLTDRATNTRPRYMTKPIQMHLMYDRPTGFRNQQGKIPVEPTLAITMMRFTPGSWKESDGNGSSTLLDNGLIRKTPYGRLNPKQ